MNVKVNYTLSSEFAADVDYEDLAEAIRADIEDGDGDFTEVPALEELSTLPACMLNKSAGPHLDELLLANGYEVDSSAAVVDTIVDES